MNLSDFGSAHLTAEFEAHSFAHFLKPGITEPSEDLSIGDYTRLLSAEEWEPHRGLVTHLYVNEGKSILEITRHFIPIVKPILP